MKITSFLLMQILFVSFMTSSYRLYSQMIPTSLEFSQTKGLFAKHVEFNSLDESLPSFKVGELSMFIDSIHSANVFASKLLFKEQDNTGYIHYKWQQTAYDIPIENAILIQHVKNNKLSSQYGYWVIDTTKLVKSVMISSELAISNAKRYVGAKIYKWEIPEEESLLQTVTGKKEATYFPYPALVFYSGEGPLTPDSLKLAYKMEIFAHYPMSRQIIFIDAKDGAVLGRRDLIAETNVPANVSTAYSGSQQVITDQVSPTLYRLRETTRGNGISVLNMAGHGANYAAATDFLNPTTTWTAFQPANDQYATDAMWGQEKTYDFYKVNFNRNSIDNKGLALVGYVHTNLLAQGYSSNVGAFWNQTVMTYGDGSGNITPLTSLDIIGHEITHGLTQYTANLAYNKESGALNEAFSDIMGTAIEFYGKPTQANWTIGENVGTIFRSMSAPKMYNQPNTFNGAFWVNTTSCTPSQGNDNCGVHTNSGVANYWFFLLVNGGVGTNDIATHYNVAGIGLGHAQTIAFQTLTHHLVPASTFSDARTESIVSATELYGANSCEVVSTTNAWNAVGVGTAFSTSNFSITGNSTICSGNAIYNLSNSAGVTSIVWSTTPSGLVTLTPNGNSVTITQTGNGLVTLTATVSGCVGTVSFQKIIGVGSASTWQISFDFVGANPGNPSSGDHLLADAYPIPGATQYIWYSDNIQIATTNTVSLNTTNWKCGDHKLTVKATTSCGTTSISDYQDYSGLCSVASRSNLFVYPNPASNTLQMEIRTDINSGKSNLSSPSVYLNNLSEVRIFDKVGNLIRDIRVQYKTKNLSIDVSNLQPDVYYLEVRDNKNSVRQIIKIDR